MHIQHNVTLKNYSTMRLGGIAKALVDVTTTNELTQAVAWAKEQKQPLLVLGGGSNVIFKDGFDGLVIINKIKGFKITAQDAAGATLHIGAGEQWDDAVERSVRMGLHGVELLSAIPGTAGATPVQNVGAYGAEIADVLVELQAYDLRTNTFVTLRRADCGFGYRYSIFKTPTDRRYIITGITLRLTKDMPKPPFYAGLQHYLDAHRIANYTPQTIRQAVIAVRARTLPDPSIMPNTGSFFKNPIVPVDQAHTLLQKYPDMPHWPVGEDRVKLAAGWMVDKAGLRGYRAHGMCTYKNNALVFVNQSAKTYHDLAVFKDEIVRKVHDFFGVTLNQEPELL